MVPKESRNFSKQLIERVEMEREKEWTHARGLKVEIFFSYLKIFIPLSWELFGTLFFLFFNTFSLYFISFFSSVSLFWDFENSWGENKLQIFLWMGWKWLHHEYENGGVADILMVDTYSGMDLCTPIFLGEASKQDFTKG
jgi:hypothetical protein